MPGEAVVQVNRHEQTILKKEGNYELKVSYAAREPFPLLQAGENFEFRARHLKVTITYIAPETSEKLEGEPTAPQYVVDNSPFSCQVKGTEDNFRLVDELASGRIKWEAEHRPQDTALISKEIWGPVPYC